MVRDASLKALGTERVHGLLVHWPGDLISPGADHVYRSLVRAKRDELVKSAEVRVAEYLMAAHAQRDQPTTEEFMLLADGADLNPTMIVR